MNKVHLSKELYVRLCHLKPGTRGILFGLNTEDPDQVTVKGFYVCETFNEMVQVLTEILYEKEYLVLGWFQSTRESSSQCLLLAAKNYKMFQLAYFNAKFKLFSIQQSTHFNESEAQLEFRDRLIVEYLTRFSKFIGLIISKGHITLENGDEIMKICLLGYHYDPTKETNRKIRTSAKATFDVNELLEHLVDVSNEYQLREQENVPSNDSFSSQHRESSSHTNTNTNTNTNNPTISNVSESKAKFVTPTSLQQSSGLTSNTNKNNNNNNNTNNQQNEINTTQQSLKNDTNLLSGQTPHHSADIKNDITDISNSQSKENKMKNTSQDSETVSDITNETRKNSDLDSKWNTLQSETLQQYQFHLQNQSLSEMDQERKSQENVVKRSESSNQIHSQEQEKPHSSTSNQNESNDLQNVCSRKERKQFFDRLLAPVDLLKLQQIRVNVLKSQGSGFFLAIKESEVNVLSRDEETVLHNTWQPQLATLLHKSIEIKQRLIQEEIKKTFELANCYQQEAQECLFYQYCDVLLDQEIQKLSHKQSQTQSQSP